MKYFELVFILLYCCLVWKPFPDQQEQMGSLVKVASEISGRSQAQLGDIYSRQVQRKAAAIAQSQDHPLRRQLWAVGLKD